MKKIMLFMILVVMLLSAPAWAEPRTIRILHVNDLHGFVHPTAAPGMKEPLGGAPQLAGRIAQLRVARPFILLAAGDMIQGESWANLTMGESVMNLMNAMGFDAMTLGNHEFDFGQAALKSRVAQAGFPVLAANVSGLEGVKPYTIIERGGLRIGIIGLVTEDVPETSHPANTLGLRFSKPLERGAELVRELRGRTDLIVLLTHIGHAGDLALAQALAGPLSAAPHNSMRMGSLVIVGGHSHTRVEHPVVVGGNYVAQAWEHGKTLGVIDVTVDDGRIVACDGELDEIRASSVGDPAVAALVKRYDDSLDAILRKEAGGVGVDLVQEGIRRRETNLGDLVADIVRQTAGAEAAIINAGSIRTGMGRGRVTLRDIYAMLPFNNYVVAVRMSGGQLLETLEHGVSGIQRGEGRFPQVSGIRFAFDPAKPPGKRVSEVSVAGRPLEKQRDYTVATLDFMAAGGDGYRAFGEAIRGGGDFSDLGGALHSSRLVYNNPGVWLRDIVADWLRKQGTVSPVVDDRIMEQR